MPSLLGRIRRRLRGAPPAGPAPAPVEPAVRVARARARLAEGRRGRVRADAARLKARAATRDAGHAIAAIAAHERGFLALAHAELAEVPTATAAVLAPAEWVRSGLAEAPEQTLGAVRALADADPPELGPEAWYELLAAVFGAGDQPLARALYARFDAAATRAPGAWPDARRRLDSLRDWVAADAGSPTAPAPPAGRRTVAIMDYGHPGVDRASANLGDHVQSIAALGHLVRHREVRLHGRPELTELLDGLGERVRPERARHEVAADVEVMTVHRDASMYQPIPEDTWVLCFGWYMHAIFTTRFGFPLHDNLRPIFVSFHCNKRDLLTPEAIAYLRRYGPVGCRDWTTVHLLQSCGVPAFFSGCLTTTIDTVFPGSPGAPADAAPAYVDVAPGDVPEGATVYKHSDPAVRRRSFTRNVGDALALLETYRTSHPLVVTSRLHCYLPVRSLGTPVEFRPHNRADVRFDGLMDIDDDAFAAIRDAMNARLERVHAAILAGAPEADVYALWRELAAPDVAAAEARRDRPVALPDPAPAHAAAADRAVAATVHREAEAAGEPVHVAVALPAGAGGQLAALVHSLLEHASRPVHLWVLARPGGGARERLAARFPGLALSWVPLRGIRPKLLRLQLPALLPGVDRVVLLPLPSVATGDVAELARLDLEGRAFAAPRRPGTSGISGFGVLHAAGNRLGDRPEVAAELRRSAHARHAFDFDAFAIGVLVADLSRLRDAPLLAVADAFGLDDRETLHWVAGPGRATVPGRWAWVPTRMPAQGPGLIHWADGLTGRGVPERAAYRRHARAARGDRRRAAVPPASR